MEDTCRLEAEDIILLTLPFILDFIVELAHPSILHFDCILKSQPADSINWCPKLS